MSSVATKTDRRQGEREIIHSENPIIAVNLVRTKFHATILKGTNAQRITVSQRLVVGCAAAIYDKPERPSVKAINMADLS